MGKHRARPRGRAIPVLGASCGLLAAAGLVGGLRPAVVLPSAGDAEVAAVEEQSDSTLDVYSLLGGPLDMPEIGVVAPGFDEYAALTESSQFSDAPAADPPDSASSPDVLPVEEPAVTPPAPTPSPSRPPASASPTPSEQPPAEEPPAEEPPVEEPPVEEPAAEEPPAEEPAVEEPPVEEPPTEEPPAEEEPPVEEPPVEEPDDEEPPAEEPDDEEPPVEEPPVQEPVDVDLTVGQAFDVLDDATGEVAFTIVLDGILTDVECTADNSKPAANGHLIGLQVHVTTGPAPVEGETPPAIRASAFEFLGAGDDVPDADTSSAAACLDEADSFPSGPLSPEQDVVGMIVLDVPELTGTIAYRPKAWGASLLWAF